MNQASSKTLLLFNHGWGAIGFARLEQSGHLIARRGFDLLSFPGNANLLTFDIDRFVSRLARRAARAGWTGVFSHHEQFGALAAALLAEKMNWPGTPSQAVAACQHKLYARQVLDRVCPQANIAYQRLPLVYGQSVPEGLSYPCFVKPIKAAFSVLAKSVHSREELEQLTRFGGFELWVIKRMVEPFERVVRRLLPQSGSAHSMMIETAVHAKQYCLDGIVFGGDVKPLGVVDAVMYPGTQAFMRFDYPSLLSRSVQSRALEVARKFLTAIGFSHGFFNMEFFYDDAADQLTVIEFNPRMASQFADLYQRVDGLDLYAMALALAGGTDPWTAPQLPRTAGCATSSVYRMFNHTAAHLPQVMPVMPSRAQVSCLKSNFADSILLQYPKAGYSLARDFKWLGSYRYGILHMGGRDAADLQQRCAAASGILKWQLPYADAADLLMASGTVLQGTGQASFGSVSPTPHLPWNLNT